MIHEDGHFTGANELELFWQCWLPDGDRRAVILLIHGLGEHSGRYDNVVDALVPRGFAIYTFDHRGHGRSPDRQCAHITDWGDYRTDVDNFRRLVRERQPDLPLFLYGHSMGGLIALNYALHHPEGLAGVVASAPALVEPETPPFMRAAVRLLSRVNPEAELDAGLDTEGLSRETAVVEAYEKDPLVHSKISARWGAEFLAAIDWTHVNAAEFEPPLLILHGEADPIVPPRGSQRFYKNVKITDKQRITYPGGYHEPHNDLQHEQVTADVSEWLENHLS